MVVIICNHNINILGKIITMSHMQYCNMIPFPLHGASQKPCPVGQDVLFTLNFGASFGDSKFQVEAS